MVEREEFHKEIDLIQACITRMADNSFRLKEWYISLIAVVAAVLISQQCNLAIVCLFILVITFLFWGLDGFFLKMETLYRWKYEWVIDQRPLGVRTYLYDLNPHTKEMRLQKEEKRFIKFLWSKTLRVFYGIIWVLSLGLTVYGIISYIL